MALTLESLLDESTDETIREQIEQIGFKRYGKPSESFSFDIFNLPEREALIVGLSKAFDARYCTAEKVDPEQSSIPDGKIEIYRMSIDDLYPYGGSAQIAGCPSPLPSLDEEDSYSVLEIEKRERYIGCTTAEDIVHFPSMLLASSFDVSTGIMQSTPALICTLYTKEKSMLFLMANSRLSEALGAERVFVNTYGNGAHSNEPYAVAPARAFIRSYGVKSL